jgi:hypothetical protein
MMSDGVTREELREDLDSVRTEFGAKIESLKWKLVAALLGGQVLAGLMAALVTKDAQTPGRVVLSVINFIAS